MRFRIKLGPESRLPVTEPPAHPVTIHLSDAEWRLLQDIAVAPDSGTVARYTRLGLSGRQGDKAKKALIDAGFVKDQERFTKRGRTKTAMLTEAGMAYLKSLLNE